MDKKWFDEKYLHPCWLISSNPRIVYIIMCMILYFRLIEDNLKRSLSLGKYLVSRQMRTMINRRFKTSLCKNQAEKLEMTTARYGRLWYKNDKNYLTHLKKIILCYMCVVNLLNYVKSRKCIQNGNVFVQWQLLKNLYMWNRYYLTFLKWKTTYFITLSIIFNKTLWYFVCKFYFNTFNLVICMINGKKTSTCT